MRNQNSRLVHDPLDWDIPVGPQTRVSPIIYVVWRERSGVKRRYRHRISRINGIRDIGSMDDRGEKQEPTLFPDRTARIGKAKENGRSHTHARAQREREKESS